MVCEILTLFSQFSKYFFLRSAIFRLIVSSLSIFYSPDMNPLSSFWWFLISSDSYIDSYIPWHAYPNIKIVFWLISLLVLWCCWSTPQVWSTLLWQKYLLYGELFFLGDHLVFELVKSFFVVLAFFRGWITLLTRILKLDFHLFDLNIYSRI